MVAEWSKVTCNLSTYCSHRRTPVRIPLEATIYMVAMCTHFINLKKTLLQTFYSWSKSGCDRFPDQSTDPCKIQNGEQTLGTQRSCSPQFRYIHRELGVITFNHWFKNVSHLQCLLPLSNFPQLLKPVLTNWFNQNNVADTRLCYKYLFTIPFQVQTITIGF